jgi:NAD-dependent dihydropyrimidine dehydrogenase PreA subunit
MAYIYALDREDGGMFKVRIDYGECEDSRNCYEICPEDVFEVSGSTISVVQEEHCTGCYLCVENCPTGAITVD